MNRRRLQQAVAVAAVVVMDTGWCAVSLSRWVYAAWTEQTTGLSVCLCVCGRICAIFVYWLPSTRWQSPGDATAVILALRFISHMRQITALTACRPCAHGRPWIALVYVDNWRRSRAPERGSVTLSKTRPHTPPPMESDSRPIKNPMLVAGTHHVKFCG